MENQHTPVPKYIMHKIQYSSVLFIQLHYKLFLVGNYDLVLIFVIVKMWIVMMIHDIFFSIGSAINQSIYMRKLYINSLEDVIF